MCVHGSGTFFIRAFALGSALFAGALLAAAQGTAEPLNANRSSAGQSPDASSLNSLVLDLQRQVQSLNSQLSELRAEEQQDRNETRSSPDWSCG